MQAKPSGPPGPGNSFLVNAGIAVLAIIGICAGFVWAAVHLVAFLTFQESDLSFGDATALMFSWVDWIIGGHEANDATLVASRQLPAPSLVVAIVALVLFMALVWAALFVYARLHHWRATIKGGGMFRPRSARERDAARWADRRDLKGILVRSGEAAGRLVLGRCHGMSGRGLLAVEQLHSIFVLGPTQSYKTSGLAIPALLEWDGPAVVTSVKRDLLDATRLARWRAGEVHIFDPAGLLGTDAYGQPIGSTWNPLDACTSWSTSREVARWLIAAAAEHKEMGDATKGFFDRRGARPLAAALWAAALDKSTILQVIQWLDELDDEPPRPDKGEPEVARYNDAAEDILGILGQAGEEDAVRTLKSVLNETERQRSGSITSAQDVMEVFGDENVQQACSVSGAGQIDPYRLLDGSGTLYLYAPLHEQDRLRPVFEALIMFVVRTAMELSARTGRPLDDRLLVLLDEAGNVAPLQSLAQLASTAAGQGIQLLTIFQDFAQVKHRYGQLAATVVNNHRAKVLLSGLSDPDSLEYVSRLIGDSAEVERSTTTGEDKRSTTDHVSYRRLAPMAALRQTKPGQGVLLYGHLPPVRLKLRWWKKDKELARLAGEPEEMGGGKVERDEGGEERADGRVVQLAHHRRRRKSA